jgi:phage shock protein B
METVERLVAADNPDFRAARLVHDRAEDTELSRELDRLRDSEKTSAAKGRNAR